MSKKKDINNVSLPTVLREAKKEEVEVTSATVRIQSIEDETAGPTDLFTIEESTTAIEKILDNERREDEQEKSYKQPKTSKRRRSFLKLKFRLNTLDKISIILLILTFLMVVMRDTFTKYNFHITI